MEISEVKERSAGIADIKVVRKKPNWKRISIAVFVVVAVILIVLVAYIIIQKNSGTKETLNITYSIEFENGSLIASGTDNFDRNSLSTEFGFATDKLDNEIKALKEGETKTITLGSEDAFGDYDEFLLSNVSRIEKLNRTYEINKTFWVTLDSFVQGFNEQPVLNKEYTIQGGPWPYKVAELNSTHVKLSHEATLNQEIPDSIFTDKVIGINESKIKIRIGGNDSITPTASGNLEVKFDDEHITTTLTPQIGQEVSLGLTSSIVTGMNSTHLFLDGNNPLAGKTLVVKIILNGISKTKITGSAVSKEGAPTMQVFIMSYCPYGLQMLKGLLPVWEKFKDKANIELRFVSYTMHGQKEEDENNRMICIREEQNSKLIDYLKCFTESESGDYSTCLVEAKIDESKLSSCMSSRAAGYFEEDVALNEQYGVQGSPTVIINGEEAQISRSPEDIKSALCSAFTTEPSECSVALSSASPTPGFGSGSSNSNQASQCGNSS